MQTEEQPVATRDDIRCDTDLFRAIHDACIYGKTEIIDMAMNVVGDWVMNEDDRNYRIASLDAVRATIEETELYEGS